MKLLLGSQQGGIFIGFLKIVTVLDQLGPERPHGGIFFRVVAVRDQDRRFKANFCRG